MSTPAEAKNVSAPQSPILIIGAGIAGLALAQSLKSHGVPFHVFERDVAFSTRGQGYRIKIFPDTTAHLRGLLPPAVFDAFEATCAETRMGEATLNALDASFIASRVLFGPKPYTVERGMFRQILMHGLEDDVHWGKSLSHFTLSSDPTAAEGVTAHFKDGSSASGSLLVAADGGRSAVRRQFLPDAATLDTGGVCIYGKTPLSPELLARLNPKLLRWFHICRDNAPLLQETILGPCPIHLLVEPMVFPNRATRDDLPADYIYWALLCPSKLLGPNDEARTKMIQMPSQKLAGMLTSQWDPSITCLFDLQDADNIQTIRIVTAKPELPVWEADSRVTLIGDAIHQMSPTGGVGAVTAIRDAATLAALLAENAPTKENIATYERGMRETAEMSIRRSVAGGKVLFGQGPLEEAKVVDVWASN